MTLCREWHFKCAFPVTLVAPRSLRAALRHTSVRAALPLTLLPPRSNLWVHKKALDSERADPDGHDHLMACIDAKDVLNHEAFGRTITVPPAPLLLCLPSRSFPVRLPCVPRHPLPGSLRRWRGVP